LLAALDRKLLRLLRTHGHWPELERAALRYARAGENGLLWQGIGSTGALLYRRRRPVYLRAMRVTALTLMANTVLKALVRRARPVLEELPALSPTLYGRSYPSAHALDRLL
jgi:membrane-associated phospholipid phosphatase